MGTTAEKLQAILNSKAAIKAALEQQGLNPSDILSSYADEILKLMAGPGVKSFEVGTDKTVNYVTAAATNGERIVIVSNTNGAAGYSDDGGKTWTTYTMPTGYQFHSMVYGDGVFVVVPNLNSNFLRSTDGINWTSHATGWGGKWNCLDYANGVFVTFCKSKDQMAYSTDGGNTWIRKTVPYEIDWSAVKWCNDRFIAVADNSTTALFSYDGITWETFTLPVSAPWSDIACGNGRNIIIAGETANSDVYLWSEDNITWHQGTFPTSNRYRKILYQNGVWIVTTNSNVILYSTDGENWTSKTISETNSLRAIVYQKGKFVAIPYNSNKAAIITTNLPPSTMVALGDAKPEDVPSGVVFTSIHGFGLIGTKATKDTYVITNAARTHSVPAVLVSKN